MRISDWSSDVCSSDLFVVGFSDIQADIAAELVRRGVEMWISNHRSVAGIVDYVRRLGALVGAAEAANAYAAELQRGIDDIAADAARLPPRPRVYCAEGVELTTTGVRCVRTPVGIQLGRGAWRETLCHDLI